MATHTDKLVVLRRPVSRETIVWLEERLEEARCGELIGIAAICMYARSVYALSVRGEIRKGPAPHVTRGLLAELDDHLRAIIRRALL